MIGTLLDVNDKQLKSNRMKKYLVILLVTLTASATSFAQFRIGPKLGANMGKIEGSGFDEKYKLGYHVGVFAEIPLGKKWAIQPEVLWNQINTDTAYNIRQVYQNLAKFGILINKDKTLIDNGGQAFKNGDFSMLFGAQLNILRIRVYGRYVIGLNDISDIGSQEEWKTTGFQLGVGLAL